MSAKISTFGPKVRPQSAHRVAVRAMELSGQRANLWAELLTTDDEARAKEIKAALTSLYQRENKLIRQFENGGGR